MRQCTLAAARGALVGLVLGFAAIAGMRLWQPAAAVAQADVVDVVRTQRLEVTDAAGVMRAVLTAGAAGPVLGLFDAAGAGRAGLQVERGRPGLWMADAAGTPLAALALDAHDLPQCRLFDTAGKQERLRLGLQPDGRPGLDLFDTTGTQRATCRLWEGDAPALDLYDARGQNTATLAIDRQHLPGLYLRDLDAATRLSLSVSPATGQPAVSLFDQAGMGRLALRLLDADGARLDLYNAAGKRQGSVIGSGANAGVFLHDRDERLRVAARLQADRPGYELFDINGRRRGSFALTGNAPAVELTDAGGTLRTRLGLAGADAARPAIDLYDRAGQPRAVIALGTEHAPEIGLREADGTTRWSAP